MVRIPWNKGVTKFYPKPCLCGCGELVSLHKYRYPKKKGVYYLVNNFIKGHHKRGVNGFDLLIHEPRLCACGCGLKTTKFRGRFSRFIKGHENIGRVPWNKGGTFSIESRKKMSIARLGKEPVNKVIISSDELYGHYVVNKKSAREVSVIMGVSIDVIKNRLQELGWSRTTKEACSIDNFKQKMRTIRIRALSSDRKIASPNKLENLVYTALDARGVQYKKQVPLFDKFVVDALLPKEKIVLEIFGKYWHTMPDVVKKDISKKHYLKKCGYEVEELWDYQIREKGVEKVVSDFVKKYNLV